MIAQGASVSARGLGRTYSDRSGRIVTALDGVTFDLAAGAFAVVRGPSGCGKSTLLNLVGALDRPTAGRLCIADVEVQDLTPNDAAAFRRARVGYLFQDAGLIEPMSALDNVELPLAYRRLSRADRRRRALAALDEVRLAGAAHAEVGRMSGGERQRVGLARALAVDASLLICDEPTAALDEDASRAVVDILIARARAGATVICSSHDPLVISRADVIIRLDRGRQVEPETRP